MSKGRRSGAVATLLRVPSPSTLSEGNRFGYGPLCARSCVHKGEFENGQGKLKKWRRQQKRRNRIQVRRQDDDGQDRQGSDEPRNAGGRPDRGGGGDRR